MAVEIDAIQSAKSIGWTDALLSRLAANSVGLGARLSITAPANASALAATGYSLTGTNASSMVDLAGTWNTTGTPTAFKLNITNTASNAASLLMDLQVGTVKKFSVDLYGISHSTGIVCCDSTTATIGSGAISELRCFSSSGAVWHARLNASSFDLSSAIRLQWHSSVSLGTADLILLRDAANTLALRNSTNAQAFNIYNTYTSGSVYERGFMRWVSNVLEIGTEHVGSSARDMVLKTGGSTVLTLGSGNATFAGNVTAGASAIINWFARARIYSPSDSVIRLSNDAANDFNRLQFGGTTSSFPALKRSSTVLQSRLADDSDFAPLQGRLRSHANATSETVTPTHTLRLFDAAGTEYRVPAIAV